MRRALIAAFLVALAVTPGALAAACPDVSIREALRGADVAFVGVLRSSSALPGRGVEQREYRFAVRQAVKGTLGDVVTVRSARLADIEGRPLEPGVTVGVLASRSGRELVTSSCGLIDPGSLIGEADEPRGTAIKVAIGALILLAVLVYAFRRLARRPPALPPRSS